MMHFRPEFLSVLLTDCECSIGGRSLTVDAIESMESFCDRFRKEWSSDTQKCLNDASIRILVKWKGITNFHLDLGTCCAHCPGRRK